MIKHFFDLQWKSFRRSASFKMGVVMNIFIVIAILYFILLFSALGFITFYVAEKNDKNPLLFLNEFLIYGLFFWVVIRHFLQKIPIINIQQLIILPITKNRIVHYALLRTCFSFFNWGNAFYFIPFSVILLIEGYPVLNVLSWHFGIFALVYCTNYINVLINNKDTLFYIVFGTLSILAALQYYDIFDITIYSAPVFESFYQHPLTALVACAVLALLYYYTFNQFRKELFLDGNLTIKSEKAKTQDFDWLNRLGASAVFIKNDIKLITRNKRSRGTILASFFFLFYGLIFFTGSVDIYDNPYWYIFAAIFTTGGFLFTFGQFVPSWDSSYYPLMMSQNISYREYLNAKWALVMAATFFSTLLSLGYVYFGWEVLAAIVAGGIYNLGINSYVVLWGGAYIKTPIDLTSAKKPFGDKKSFNTKTLLLTIPKLFLPVGLFALGNYFFGIYGGYLLVGCVGILGFIFKAKVFDLIESIYKDQKYKTLAAYKQKN